MKEIEMNKPTVKAIIKVLEDIELRATLRSSFMDGYEEYKASIKTLIKTLEGLNKE